MTIAVASGKGGTGKTTLATNLAVVLHRHGRAVMFLDTDVEEPNGHVFLRPEWNTVTPVTIPMPVVDQDACIHCGKCMEICRYGAIVDMKNQTLVFNDLCHSCGGCHLVCPVYAITEEPVEIGELSKGRSGGMPCVQGALKIGHPAVPPVIAAVKRMRLPDALNILDAPPGTSCPVIEAVHDADHVILVTEPTPFGLHDLTLAVDMLDALNRNYSVVVNRTGRRFPALEDYLRKRRIPVLLEIPDDRRVAEAYSVGRLAVDVLPDLEARLMDLAAAVTAGVRS